MEMIHVGQADPKQNWVSASPFIGWLAMDNPFYLNEPQFSHLSNGHSYDTYVKGREE